MQRILPDRIKKIVGERTYTEDKTGMSDSAVLCFGDMVLKIEKENEESDNEYRMLAWLQGKLPVPRLLAFEKSEGYNYLLMSKMEGVMTCDPFYLENPEKLLQILAQGLKMLWAVEITGCPYRNDVENKLRSAGARIEDGLCDRENAEPDTYGTAGFKDPRELFNWLVANKPEEEYVFSHGDYCLPNVFVKDGAPCGFIDLGRAGVADRWQDIALCLRSLGFNTGREKEAFVEPFCKELGVKPAREKIRYYILLDELF